MRRPLAVAAGLILAAALLAGCGGTSNRALDASLVALNVHAPSPSPSSPSPPAPACGEVTASLRPPATLPPADLMPTGSYMATIQRRGYLIAGVDQNTLRFAYFNPLDSKLEGFEIDVARELARAILGDPSKVRFKVITTDQRVPDVQNGSVDVVIDAFTITCARKQQIDFSTVYYNAGQKLLVPVGSPIHGVADLAGKRVCATTGSTSLANIERLAPKAKPVPVAQRTDCLVALQEGTADAVTSDDSILLGFEAQDPYTRIVGASFSPQPYGIGINKAHPEFVRFVNGVLEQMRTDGTWARIYSHWLGTPPPPPTPHYSG